MIAIMFSMNIKKQTTNDAKIIISVKFPVSSLMMVGEYNSESIHS